MYSKLAKPPFGAQLDRSDGIGRNISSLYLFNEQFGGAIDIALPRRPAITNGSWAKASRGNVYFSFSSAAADTEDLQNAGAFSSILWFQSFGALPSAEYLDILARYNYSSEASNAGWTWQCRPYDDGQPGLNFITLNNANFANYACSSGVPVGVGEYFAVGTSDGTTRKVYINGVLVATKSFGSIVGATSASLHSNFNGHMPAFPYMIAVVNRVLTGDEVASLYANPYRMIVYPKPRFYSLPAAGTGRAVGIFGSGVIGSGTAGSGIVVPAISRVKFGAAL